MTIEILDTRGLKSPEPVLKIAAKAAHMIKGSILEVLGDLPPAFEKDVQAWCEGTGRILPSTQSGKNNTKIIHVQL